MNRRHRLPNDNLASKITTVVGAAAVLLGVFIAGYLICRYA
jgi:hypothetical protein